MKWVQRRAIAGLLTFSIALAIVAIASANARAEPKAEIVPIISHSGDVNAVALSLRGHWLLSGSDDGTMKLWHVRSGRLVRTIQTPNGHVTAVAFAADGRHVLSGPGSNFNLDLFEVGRSRSFKRKEVQGGETYPLFVWDVVTGKLVRSLPGHFDRVDHIEVAHDGKLVLSVSTGGNSVRIWDFASGQLVLDLKGRKAALSQDGKRVVVRQDDKMLRIFDVASGELVREFGSGAQGITSLAVSSDDALLAAGTDDGVVKFYELSNGRYIPSTKVHDAAVSKVAFLPDGRVLSGGADNALIVSDVRKKDASIHRQRFEGHSGNVKSIAASPDSTFVVSGSADHTIRVWSLNDDDRHRRLRAQSPVPGEVAISSSGKLLLTSGPHASVRIWESDSGRMLRTQIFEGDAQAAFAVSPDEKLVASGGTGSKIRLWRPETGEVLRTLEGHADRINAITFSADGQFLLSGSKDKSVKLWAVADGALVRTLEGHMESVQSVAVSRDGSLLASGSDDKTARIWNRNDGTLVRAIGGHAQTVYSLAFDGDTRHLATGSMYDSSGRLSAGFLDRMAEDVGGNRKTFLESYPARIWDIETGRQVFGLEDYGLAFSSVAFSPVDSKLLFTAYGTAMKLWNTSTGTVVREFRGHSGWITSLAISADGSRLVSGSNDRTIAVWDTATGHRLATIYSGADDWLVLTPEGFFNASSEQVSDFVSIVRGLRLTNVGQLWQSLYSPDLVRENLAGDPKGEVRAAAQVINLEKVIDSGPAPMVAISSHPLGSQSATELVAVGAKITDQGKGVGRIEWRVNGVTAAVSNPSPRTVGRGTTQQLALDPGENTIEVVAYNGGSLLASVPARTTITYTGPADATKPNLYVLAIGINTYVDKGGVAPGETRSKRFPPLGLAVADAKAIGLELEKAGAGLYGEVRVRTVLDAEATLTNLDAVVMQMATEIHPRDTFVLFAAAHGYSHEGRFYLIPQDYQGGTDPQALAARAIDQLKLQDWIANRIKAKKALILLDTCESGALTAGYTRSRFDGPTSDAAIGRLHEATGRPVLTAAALGQDALEKSDLGHGVFTSALIDALYRGDRNANGQVSVSELAAHVQDLVPKLIKDPKTRAEVVRRGLVGGVQTARFGSRGEDFALVLRLH